LIAIVGASEKPTIGRRLIHSLDRAIADYDEAIRLDCSWAR
jgi:hypothetical protein